MNTSIKSKYLSGFRKGYITQHCLVNISERLKQVINKGLCTGILLTDLTNPFVCTGILLTDLTNPFVIWVFC